jgi:Concanavalin A-like lectin/glucanases superfamily
MHTLYAALTVILCSATLALAQPVQVNPAHPMAQGLVQWHLALPLLGGGPQWWNLLGVRHGTLTNMGTGSGWQFTGRAGGRGELRFDASDDYVDLGSVPLWDFANTTFTVAVRFRFTAAQTGIILASRATSAAFTGGYMIRAETGGTLTVRILATGSTVAGERTTVRTVFADGQWHSVVVVFRTDTATLANNDIAIFTDGVSDQTTPLTQTASTPYEPCSVLLPGCPLRLGAPSDNASQQFGGALDDVRLWQRGLSPAEVLAYHTQGPPSYGGLLGDEALTVGTVTTTTPATRRRTTMQ